MHKPSQSPVSFASLLAEALQLPGRLHEAYRAFRDYSIGNAWALTFQILGRGLQLGPCAGYHAWRAKGRQVRKGEKGLWVCCPCMYTRRDEAGRTVYGPDGRPLQRLGGFVWRASTFTLCQTDGSNAPAVETAPAVDWDSNRALASLGLTLEPFALTDGNVQGYARPGIVAVNPLAYNPVRTLVHEIAHNVLGHVGEAGALMVDGETLDACDRESEAEAVAYVVLASLGVQGEALEYSRGYLQAWNAGRGISDAHASRVFKAADRILKAGAPVAVDEAEAVAAETEAEAVAVHAVAEGGR